MPTLNRWRFGTGAVSEPTLHSFAARRTTIAPDLPTTARMWTPGPVLNQGRLGACAAFSIVGDLIAEPMGDLTVAADLANKYAVGQFQRARVLGGWPANPSDGPSGSTLARNIQAATERGTVDGYRQLASAEEVATTVATDGPVVISIRWVRSLEQTAASGLMRYDQTGSDRGDHALLVTGYDPAYRLPRRPKRLRHGRKKARPPMPPEPMLKIRNSWGSAWGERLRLGRRSGDGWLRLSDLTAMWAAGDATAYTALGRHPVDIVALLATHPDPNAP